jgi:hypothetical protein
VRGYWQRVCILRISVKPPTRINFLIHTFQREKTKATLPTITTRIVKLDKEREKPARPWRAFPFTGTISDSRRVGRPQRPTQLSRCRKRNLAKNTPGATQRATRVVARKSLPGARRRCGRRPQNCNAAKSLQKEEFSKKHRGAPKESTLPDLLAWVPHPFARSCAKSGRPQMPTQLSHCRKKNLAKYRGGKQRNAAKSSLRCSRLLM